MNGSTLFVINLIATWYMVGLIWMVQIVHYNLFDRVGVDHFQQYEVDHSRLITPIVAVPMLLELATSVGLLFAAPERFPPWAAMTGLVLIGLIWLSTAILQIPCHAQLARGFDDATYRRLVRTNWLRTVLWTGRGGLMAFYTALAVN